MTDLVSEARVWYPEAKRLCAVFGSYSYGQGKLLATDANAKIVIIKSLHHYNVHIE